MRKLTAPFAAATALALSSGTFGAQNAQDPNRAELTATANTPSPMNGYTRDLAE
jgi:hypothetical protein